MSRFALAYLALAAVAAAAVAALVLELRASPSPGPEQVAVRFIRTAVQRDHGEQAAGLVTDELRGGRDRGAWREGLLRVVPFPQRIVAIKLRTLSRTPLVASLAVKLRAAAAGGTFLIELRRVRGRWLVDYWGPAMLVAPG